MSPLVYLALSGCTDEASSDNGAETAESADETGEIVDSTDTDSAEETAGETGGNNGGTNGGEPSGEFEALSVRLSTGVGTVVIVDWQIDGADSVWVEYGTSTSYGQEAPARASDPSRALILGVAPQTRLHVRAAAEVGGSTVYSDDVEITTGSAPSDIPSYNIVENDTRAAFGNYILTSFFYAPGAGSAGVILMNREGDLVWWTEARQQFLPAARVSRDGEAIWTLSYTSITDAESAQVCRHDLDGETTACMDTPYCHHDFVELPNGDITCLQEVTGTWRSYDLVGDALTVFDGRGGSEELWNAFEDNPPTRVEDHWAEHVLDRGVDWTHANGMWWDEEADTYYVSFYYWESIFKIPASGGTEWIFGGNDTSFRNRGETFGPQHAPQWADGTIFLFDNSESGQGGSRIASYTLDESAMEARAGISWRHPDERRAGVMGDTNLLGNGYVATAWGDVGQMIIFDDQGEIAWWYEPEAATSSCQMYVFDDMYTMTPFP